MHEFDNNFVMDWDLVWRSFCGAAFLFGGMLAAWLIPSLLKWLFRRVLHREIVYRPPLPYETEYEYQQHRLRYAHASYWRTSFFDIIYAIVAIGCILTGLIICLWFLQWDFFSIMTSLGLYTAIALFQIGSYLQNTFAFFCLKLDLYCSVREGDLIDVMGHQGYLTHIGIQRSILETAVSTNNPLPIPNSTSFIGSLPSPIRPYHPKIIMIPTAALMQIVTRLDRI